MLLLKDLTTDALAEQGAALGLTPRMARQLQTNVIKRKSAMVPSELKGVGKKLWGEISANLAVPNLTLVNKVVSPYDGFAKYLFRGTGDAVFEAVRIPLMHRPGDEKYIVCVSSQAGCAAACDFCATGKMGLTRSLATWEIVDQVIKVAADSEHPVRGVVFMGMGEPFHNYSRVLKAAKIMSDPSALAIDGKAITISTVGITPMIRRFTEERQPYRLIVSVHSSIMATRDAMMPINQAHPLPEVIEALKDYQAVTGRRVILAWTMMSGVNMDLAHAKELGRLTAGLKILLDLIPVNDASGRFQPPGDAEYNAFLDALRAEVGCPVVRRYSGGQDIHGACGMLAGLTTPAALTAAALEPGAQLD